LDLKTNKEKIKETDLNKKIALQKTINQITAFKTTKRSRYHWHNIVMILL